MFLCFILMQVALEHTYSHLRLTVTPPHTFPSTHITLLTPCIYPLKPLFPAKKSKSQQTLKQFEQEAQAVPAGDGDAFNPFEATYATGGSRGKGKGVQGEW